MTVAELRRMRGKSQQEIADLLNISLVAYRDKEMGKTRFYLNEARKICEYLKFPLADIQD